jgi:hypothetical protein
LCSPGVGDIRSRARSRSSPHLTSSLPRLLVTSARPLLTRICPARFTHILAFLCFSRFSLLALAILK